jgi:hypothetical protein
MSGTAEGKIPLSFDYCIRADLTIPDGETETAIATKVTESEEQINFAGQGLAQEGSEPTTTPLAPCETA